MSFNSLLRRFGGTALFAAFAAVAVSSPVQAAPMSDAEAAAHESWRSAISRTPVPFGSCFHAEYPNTVWSEVACAEAPDREYLPHLTASGKQTAGDGNDYAAAVVGTIKSAEGSFPAVTGVKTERDGRANVYSIQLNSNFMTKTAACNGGKSKCMPWEQFVYSSSEKAAFMQYWLIYYGKCPSGWNTSGTSCWKNSAAVTVPQVPITELSGLKLSGSAVLNGLDTLVFTTPTEAYSTTGSDSVTDLATDWNQAEFNIIGDGGGSAATFNTGSSLTVKVTVDNGTSNAPQCLSNAGTTAETNNLNLGACTTSTGSPPYIQFVESN